MATLAAPPPFVDDLSAGSTSAEVSIVDEAALPAVVHRPTPSIAAILGFLWLAGSGAAFSQLLVSAWLVRRIARLANPVVTEHWRRWLADAAAHLGLTRRVSLVMTPSVAVPVVWGYTRGVVMLPADADRWPEDRARDFLLHELAHVRRYDCLTLTLANVVRALYWPHPLVWWAVRRLRSEAERACDDRVLASGPPRRSTRITCSRPRAGFSARRGPWLYSPWPNAEASKIDCSPCSIPDCGAAR